MLPVVISGGHMFLPACGTLLGDTDGVSHYTYYVPIYIKVFQLDGH